MRSYEVRYDILTIDLEDLRRKNMNTLYFQYAVEVEKTGSITKAAANLFMAQPNLSKALKDLEESLGYEIFDRNSQGVTLTDKGNVFLTYAKNILEQLNELENITGDPKRVVQEIKVSIPRGSYIAHGFTEFVADLSLEQNMDITIKETNSLQAIADITDAGHNLGIIRYQEIYENYFLDYLKRKDLDYDVIWEFKYVVVMSKNHPLANKEKVTAQDLKDYIEISHRDTEIPFIHETSNSQTENNNKHIYVYERGSQFDLLSNVANTYMWVSPIPERYLEQFGLVQRACDIENNDYKDLLVYKNGYHFTKLDKSFQMKLYESKIDVSSKKVK